MARKRKPAKLNKFQLKVLSLLFELKEQGVCPCNSGIRKLLLGSEEYMEFSEFKMFGCYSVVSRKAVSGALTALENRAYVTSFFNERYNERFFLIEEIGYPEAEKFLSSYDKMKKRPHLKRIKAEIIPIP